MAKDIITVDEFGRSANLVRPTNGGQYGSDLDGREILYIDPDGNECAGKVSRVHTRIYTRVAGSNYVYVDVDRLSTRVA